MPEPQVAENVQQLPKAFKGIDSSEHEQRMQRFVERSEKPVASPNTESGKKKVSNALDSLKICKKILDLFSDLEPESRQTALDLANQHVRELNEVEIESTVVREMGDLPTTASAGGVI